MMKVTDGQHWKHFMRIDSCVSGRWKMTKRGCQKRGLVNPWVGRIPWKRKWQRTPVFLPRKSHGPRSLAGYSPWGHKGCDTTAPVGHSSQTGRSSPRPQPRSAGVRRGGQVTEGLLASGFLQHLVCFEGPLGTPAFL